MVEGKLWPFRILRILFQSAMDELYQEKELKDIRPFQISQPTRCNNFSNLLRDVYSYVQLNMFWESSRPSSGAQQMQ